MTQSAKRRIPGCDYLTEVSDDISSVILCLSNLTIREKFLYFLQDSFSDNNKSQNMTTILLIDDEAHFRESMRCFLEDLDYTIIEAENGSLGLQKIADEHPDLVLLDLSMPKMGGLDVLAALSEEDKIIEKMPVIVVSGNGMMEDVVEALRLNAWDYLFKPIEDFTVLEHAVTKALERSELIKENQRYQKHLEVEVEKRTHELQLANVQLMIEKKRAEVASDCKSRFLRNINHEFRTPLNGIFGYADFIKDRAEDDDDEVNLNDAGKIIGLAERLLSMITGVMDLVELDNDDLEFDWVEMKFLIAQVMDELSVKMQDSSNIIIHEFDGLQKIHTDKIRLVQSLVRIVENGSKFSDGKPVHIFVEKNKTHCFFRIQDEGIGIPENKLDNIFEPLYQVDESTTRAHDGAGIGLAVAIHYVNLLNGSIDVVSRLKEGSTFIVSVPNQ